MPPRPSELVACIGSVTLLVALILPITWITETSTGGITGQGTGEQPDDLTAWNLFSAGVIPIALGAALPLAGVWRGWLQPTQRLVGVGLVLIAVLVVVLVRLIYATPPCCDQIYTLPEARAGLVVAFVGSALLGAGAFSAWAATRRRAASGPQRGSAAS